MLVDAHREFTYLLSFLQCASGKPLSQEDAQSLSEYLAGDHPGSLASVFSRSLATPDMMRSALKGQTAASELLARMEEKVKHGYIPPIEEIRDFFVRFEFALPTPYAMLQEDVMIGARHTPKDTIHDTTIHSVHGNTGGWVLELTVEGRGNYNYYRRQFQAEPSDLMLLSPDAFYEQSRARQADSWLSYWLYFPLEQRLVEWMQWPEIAPYIYQIKLAEAQFSLIKSLFETAFETQFLTGNQQQAYYLSVVEQVLIIASSTLDSTTLQSPDSRVHETMNTITRDLAHSHTIDELAARVNLSRAQLSALFKSLNNCSIVTWREERRIAKASELLAHSSMQVQEIATQVGYDDPLYFSRVYTRLVGCSPSQYRQKLQRVEA